VVVSRAKPPVEAERSVRCLWATACISDHPGAGWWRFRRDISLEEADTVADTGQVLLLAPADPLRARRADEHFAAEAAAARDAGHDVALIDHDMLAEPDGTGRAVARVPPGGAAAGWSAAAGTPRWLARSRPGA
jgi:hypothetical protein